MDYTLVCMVGLVFIYGYNNKRYLKEEDLYPEFRKVKDRNDNKVYSPSL